MTAANELNELLGLEPRILANKLKKDELTEVLREAADLVEPDDELTDATEALLAELIGDGDDAEEETPEPEEEPEPKPKAKAKPEPAEKKMTRVQSVVAAIKMADGPMTRIELAGKANDLYARSGGTSNLSEAKWSVGQVLATLEAWGDVAFDDGMIIRKDV